MSRYLLPRALLVSCCLAVAACASMGPSRAAEIHGTWSSDGIRLTLSGTTGTVEFDCGSISIDGLLAPESRRRFRASGLLHPAAGGPAIYPPPPGREPWPVKLRGKLRGDRLRLAVIRPKPRREGERRRAVYRLERGDAGRLRQCL